MHVTEQIPILLLSLIIFLIIAEHCPGNGPITCHNIQVLWMTRAQEWIWKVLQNCWCHNYLFQCS